MSAERRDLLFVKFFGDSVSLFVDVFGKPNLRRLMLSLTEESTFEQVRNSVFEIFVSDVRTGPKPKQEVPNGNAGTKM